MNETTVSLRATPTPIPFAGYLGALLATAILVIAGCRGGSTSDAGSVDSFQRTGIPVLDAVAYSRPSEALADPSDPVLADYGDLLFPTRELLGGYVLDDRWCDTESARCVTVSSDEDENVLFDGEPLESFVVEADYRVDGSELEVVDVRALHHPVSDQLRLVVEVESNGTDWSTGYERVEITSEATSQQTRLDGPTSADSGVVSRFELGELDEPVSGPITIVIPFTDGVSDGERVELTVTIDDTAPAIDRPEAPLGERPPNAIYRASEPLPEDDKSSEDDAEAVAALIAAIVDGADASELVAPDSPGALAVEALQQEESAVRLRRDPDDASSLCWQTHYRGTFCERWSAGDTRNGVLTSWSVEGIPIDELVATRDGNLPGATMTLVRAPSSDVVLAAGNITNNTAVDLRYTLYDPMVQRGDLVQSALVGKGPYEVVEGDTEPVSALVESADFDFDLLYMRGLGVEADNLRFDANAGSRSASSDSGSDDLDAASVRLASLLQKQRFDDAVDQSSPGSSAEAYLTAISTTLSESRLWIDDGDEPAGSTKVCGRDSGGVTCTIVEVTALDDDGRVRGLTIEGIDVETLLASDRKAESGDFEATVNYAALWPKWGVFTDWSVTNSSEADVSMDGVAFVSPDGVITPSERSVYDDLPAGRTVTGVSHFVDSSLDGVIEFKARGRDAVREATLSVPLTGSLDTVESNVELESQETKFETPGGTMLTIPGDWSEMIWYDEETNQIAGDGTSLRRVKSIHRNDMTLLAFSPEFSPVELSSDALVTEINSLTELSDVVPVSMTTSDGKTVDVVTANTKFADQDWGVLIVPGTSDLVFLAFDSSTPDNADEAAAVTRAVMEQLGIVVADEQDGPDE